MVSRFALTVLGAVLVFVACNGTAEDRGADDGTDPTDAGTDGSDSDAGDEDSASETAGTGDTNPAYCPHIDVLFMVDNSGSMADNQDSLIASFPGFAEAMKAQLVHAPSTHIGVVVPDLSRTNPVGQRDIGCLITQTAGALQSSNQVCTPFVSGGPYLDLDEPDLADKFACVAKVGVGGADDERPMRAILNAVKPAKNEAGGCNEGFARTDSLLVIVIMTDEDDVPDVCDDQGNCETYGSGGTPDDWTEELLAVKNDHPENVVVLSLIGLTGDNTCGAVPASKIMGFTNNFENSYKSDICADSYDEFFAASLPIITAACETWVE